MLFVAQQVTANYCASQFKSQALLYFMPFLLDLCYWNLCNCKSQKFFIIDFVL